MPMVSLWNRKQLRNGQWQDFEVEAKGECNRHKIVVTEAGELDVTLQAFCGYNYADLRDGDLVRWHHYGLWGSNSDPKTENMVYDVLPGVYFVDFDCYNNPGAYRIKAKFTPANNNEKEPNNTYRDAQAISFGQKVTGFLTKKVGSADYQDLDDYYKLVVPKKQKVKITYHPEKGNGVVYLYDKDMIKLDYSWRYKAEPFVWEKELGAGTYYIRIESANQAGKYTLVADPELKAGSIYNDPITNIEYQVVKENNELCLAVDDIGKIDFSVCKVPDFIAVGGAQVKVVAIGENAFKNCTKLEEVTIGKNVKSIGASAFRGCKNLTTIKGASNVTSLGKNAFYKCDKLKTIGNKKNTVTLSKATSIGTKAFYGCKNLTKVNITSTKLKKINESAFSGCKNLKNITIKSKNLKSVGKNAFKNINKNCKLKVAASRLKSYRSIFKRSKIGKSVKIGKL